MPNTERRHEERRKLSDPVEEDRRISERRNVRDWGSRLNSETAALAERVGKLTDALTEIGRVQDKQIQLELDIRSANEETRDLNELITHGHQRRQRRTYLFIVVISVIANLVTLGIGALLYFTLLA